MEQLLINDGNKNYIANTVDDDGEFLTVLMQDNKIISIFKHTLVHDRHYCDSLYGDADKNYEYAERINTILMEQEGD